MRKSFLWLVAALAVIGSAIAAGNWQPTQRGLKQCADNIMGPPQVCIFKGRRMEWCCVPLPYRQWRMAWCLVDVYQQLRPPPFPPSTYYTKRRNCAFSGTPCTPLVPTTCPLPGP